MARCTLFLCSCRRLFSSFTLVFLVPGRICYRCRRTLVSFPLRGLRQDLTKPAHQLISFLVAAIVTVFIGWLADRTKARGLCNISTSFLGIVGFAMLLGAPADAAGVKYAGTFLGALGIYPNV